MHLKVAWRGYHEVITQMYFASEPLNQPDQILRALAPEERDRVTVRFQPALTEPDAEAGLGVFDITLRKAG